MTEYEIWCAELSRGPRKPIRLPALIIPAAWSLASVSMIAGAILWPW